MYIINDEKIKVNAKKTAQYTIGAPFIVLSTVLYATSIGIWQITKTTANVLKNVPLATFKNTSEYVKEINNAPVLKKEEYNE
jgi:hypothetical protein